MSKLEFLSTGKSEIAHSINDEIVIGGVRFNISLFIFSHRVGSTDNALNLNHYIKNSLPS